VSDSSRVLASPHSTIERSGDAQADYAAVCTVVHDVGAVHLVVGLPLGLDGRRGRAARAAQEEAEALERLLAPAAVSVELFDERFTTSSAERSLAEAGRRGRARP